MLQRDITLDWSIFQPDDCVTEAVLGRRWSRSIRTLQRWRVRGYGPPYLVLGRATVYRVADIEAFETQVRIDPRARP